MATTVSRRGVQELSRSWWLFLITGIAWFLISLVVLRFDTTSVATVGILLGVLFLMAGFNEVMAGSVHRSWRWAHVLLAILFFAGAIWSFASPFNAFWALASVLGFLLIFKGTLDLITAIMTKEANPLWGLGLTAGILEILLGFWASQQYFRGRATLILVWVGFMALFRGFSEIMLAFQLRHAGKELQRSST
jgi:uncharacterized membrane protein HdeD (DUF308 family)